MRRVLALLLLAIPLVLAVVLTPSVVHASTIPPIAPGVPVPLNVLPSVVKGAVNAPAGSANIAVLLSSFSKDARFWNYVKAAQAGTISAADNAALTLQKLDFKVPAVKTATLTKLVAGASTAQLGLSVGLMVGDAGARLFGFKDSDVCGTDGPGGVMRTIAGLTNGVDCNAFDMTAEAVAEANSDASVGLVGARLCYPGDPTSCIQFIGKASDQFAGQRACFDLAGAVDRTVRVLYANGTPSDVSFGNLVYDATHFGDTCRTVWANPGAGSTGWGPQLGGVASYQFYDGSTPAGTPASVVASSADPERFLRCTFHLVGGSSVSALSTGFHESDGEYAPTVCPELPDGGILESWDVDLIGGPDELNLLHEQVTPEYGDWAATYPECGDGTCMLDLRKADVSCFTNPAPCANWFADPDKEGTYQCRYGDHAVALSECNAYGPSFKPDATTTGQEYGDPETGEGQSTTTPKDQQIFGQGVQDPEGKRQCFPTGWAVLNPVEWVVKPVGCALEWAFVPRESVIAQLGERLDAKAGATVIGGGAQLLGALETAFDVGASDCMGPAWHLEIAFPWADGGLDEIYYPFASCEAPMSNFAQFFNLLTQGFVGIAAAFAALRYFAAVVGFVGVGGGNKSDNEKVRFK